MAIAADGRRLATLAIAGWWLASLVANGRKGADRPAGDNDNALINYLLAPFSGSKFI